MSEEMKWVVSADDKDVIAAFKRMQKETDKAKQALKDAGEAGAKAGKQSSDAFGGTIKNLREMVSLATVTTTAIAGSVAIYRNWEQEVNRVREAHKGLQSDIIKTISANNDLRNASQIETAIKNLKGLTPGDATRGFGAATAGSPSMNWQKRLDIVRESAPLAAMGHDIAGQANMAAKLAELDPMMSANDSADLALFVRQRLGEDASKAGGGEWLAAVGRAKQVGMSTDEAVGIGVAGVEANLPAGVIGNLMGKLIESDPNKGKPIRSAEDRAKANWYKLPTWQEKLRAVQNDAKLAGTILGTGGAMDLSAMGDGSTQAAAARAAREQNLVQQNAADFNNWQGGKLAQQQYFNQVKVSQTDTKIGDAMAPADTLRQTYAADAYERNSGTIGQANYRWQMGTNLYARQMWAAATGGDQVQAVRAGIQNEIDFNRGGANKNLLNKDDGKRYDDFIKSLDKNTKAVEEQNRIMGGNGGKPPAKKIVNADRHID
ncbi:hypothetical protein ETAA8_28480 [Anatilimnocola aggregata]|uniref:Uncharacterized protein n=1 Tax=Anatilimnocola aggregata TaxID=2528021 RepID=A0A517YBY7_9BACT|nr:hypothetical protein [Anatilimnocola aggregata]QDU27758.1 hypothetical protein ETAA8_28480 [Anatilimnocola aggregata]